MATDRLKRSTTAITLFLAVTSQLVACGSANGTKGSAKAPQVARADFGVETYLPLINDTVLSFETEVEGASEHGLLVMQIHRPRPELVELKIGNKIRRLDLVKEGVRVVEGGWLLKLPLEVGATFSGQYGAVKVTKVGLTVEVPAGRFEGCVETEETSGTNRTLTQYCPTVGIAQLEVESLSADAPGREVAKLKFHGPLVDLGQDQVKVSP